MNDYILPICAVSINGATPYFLAFFKTAYLSTTAFFASRFPLPAEICIGVKSSVPVKLTDIPLSSNNLIISTLNDAEIKLRAVIIFSYEY